MRESAALRALALMVGGGLAYAFVVAAFPASRMWFGEPESVNRTLLALAPLTAAWVALLAHAWVLDWQAPRAMASAVRES